MGYRSSWSGPLVGEDIDFFTFRFLFIVGPLLVAFVQWGSNLIWGSVFGLGWCLSAFATGGLVHNSTAMWVGLAWGWLVLIPLSWLSARLWHWLAPTRRKLAVTLLFTSFLINVPAEGMMAFDEYGVHLPDYGLHLAESY